MFDCETIKNKIETKLNKSIVQVEDTRNDNSHFKAVVIWKGFKGKTLVEQHKLVYNAIDEEMKAGLHSLSLRTKIE